MILISDDSTAKESQVPTSNRKKKTVAEIEYELLHEKPGFYTQEELQFETHVRHKEVQKENREEEKERFFGKSRACMRASALPKRFGWGIYFDSNGKAELVPVESAKYQDLQKRENIKLYKAMKSKR